ncbi:MAG: hypothetical protein Q8P57_00420 [Candidatus Pacearchaeota archaeon]|nr:hypothetical protein [Candidatus Pacearchaeota archaeon]
MNNRKKLEIFLEFLIFGVIMGVIEDVIALKFATSYSIDSRAIFLAIIIAIPFAFIGEVIIDNKKFKKTLSKNKKIRRLEIFAEFLLAGILLGVIEDLLAIFLISGEPFSLTILGIVTLVTIPFAIIGEIIVDKQDLISCKIQETC